MGQKQITSTHSRAIGALLLAFLVPLASWMPSATMAQSAKGVMAAYKDYNVLSVNWQLIPEKCPDLDDDNYSLAWRSQYRWTEFCGPRAEHECLRCLQVTNAATAADDADPATTPANSVTVRVVDICSRTDDDSPVLRMDSEAFGRIDDPEGSGKNAGQLRVNYQFVDCEDVE